MNENVVSENGGAIQKNTFGLIGTKVGMSRIFEEDGVSVPITVINVGMNVVSSVKTVEKDGYCAVQVGYRETKKK